MMTVDVYTGYRVGKLIMLYMFLVAWHLYLFFRVGIYLVSSNKIV